MPSMPFSWPPIPAAAAAGVQSKDVLQSVRTQATASANTTSLFPNDGTIPQIGEGAAYASLDTTITPRFSSSTLLVEVFFTLISSSGALNFVGCIFRDSGPDALVASVQTMSGVNGFATHRIEVSVPASAAVATTFKFRYGGLSAGTYYLLSNGGGFTLGAGTLKASMRITEIAA